jgi:TolA-binding protein
MPEEGVHNTKWWATLVSPQVLLAILAGFGSLVVFWTNANNTSNDVKVLKDQMSNKADLKVVDAASDRVQRQYEQLSKMSDRITALEKEIEYQRGMHDEMDKHLKEVKH